MKPPSHHSPPDSEWVVERERIARIIDPDAWGAGQGSIIWSEHGQQHAQAAALTKADAILSLLSASLVPLEGVENGSENAIRAAAGPQPRIAPEAERSASRDQPWPAAPWPIGAQTNCNTVGWNAYFQGHSRERCPFPPTRRDLQDGYREGWDSAQAHDTTEQIVPAREGREP